MSTMFKIDIRIKYLIVVIILLLTSLRQKDIIEDKLIIRQDSVYATYCENRGDKFSNKLLPVSAVKYYKKAANIFYQNNFILPAIRNYRKVGISFYENYQLDKSEEYLLKSKSLLEENFCEDDGFNDEKEKILCNLGELYLISSSYLKSKEFFYSGLNEIPNLSSSETEKLSKKSDYYRYLSMLYNFSGKIDSALHFCHRMLEGYSKLYGEKSNTCGRGNFDLANIYLESQNYYQALFLYKRALSIFIMNNSEESMNSSNCYFNIGTVYFNIGRYNEALNYYSKTLSIQEKMFDDNHINIIRLYKSLANVYGVLKQKQEFQTYSNIVLNFYKKTFGDNSNEVALEFDNYGSLYLMNNDYEKALQNFKEGLRIRKKLFNNNDKLIVQSNYNIGQCYLELRQYNEAIKYFHYSLSALMPNYSEIDPFNDPINFPNIENYNFTSDKNDFSLHDLLNILSGQGKAFLNKYFYTKDSIDLLKCHNNINAAVYISNHLKKTFHFSESKYVFSKNNKNVFSTAIKSNIENDNQAFQYSEMSKNQILQYEILKTKAKQIAGIPVDILKTESKLKDEMSELLIKINDLKRNRSLIDDPIIIHAESDYFNCREKYDSVLFILNNHHHNYKRYLSNYKICTIEEIQAKLQENELMLEYFVGDDDIYIFCIGKNLFQIKSTPTELLEESIFSIIRSVNKLEKKNFMQYSIELYNILIKPIEKYLLQ